MSHLSDRLLVLAADGGQECPVCLLPLTRCQGDHPDCSPRQPGPAGGYREQIVQNAGELAALIARVGYKPGWRFLIYVAEVLEVHVATADSETGEPAIIRHRRPIPPIPMTEARWRRWLLEQVILVESHEAMEHLTVDGTAPFFPDHQPGGNPYRIVDRTSQ